MLYRIREPALTYFLSGPKCIQFISTARHLCLTGLAAYRLPPAPRPPPQENKPLSCFSCPCHRKHGLNALPDYHHPTLSHAWAGLLRLPYSSHLHICPSVRNPLLVKEGEVLLPFFLVLTTFRGSSGTLVSKDVGDCQLLSQRDPLRL